MLLRLLRRPDVAERPEQRKVVEDLEDAAVTSGQASKPAANRAPASAGFAAAARLRGTDVTLAAAACTGGVNTIVFTRPMRADSQAATGNENAASTPDQKKKSPAAESERPNLLNSHNASSDCTAKPPAKASMLNKAEPAGAAHILPPGRSDLVSKLQRER